MRVADIEYGSTVNGPGSRAVIHLAGCSLRCPGCINAHLQPHTSGKEMSVADIVVELEQYFDEGEDKLVTISGGEPTEQIEELVKLLGSLVVRSSHVILFTGKTKEALTKLAAREDLYSDLILLVDVIVAGPYVRELSSTTNGLLASSNQEYVFLNGDDEVDPYYYGGRSMSITVSPSGITRITGLPPDVDLGGVVV